MCFHFSILFEIPPNKKYPKCNILWICESKSILEEQFNKTKIKEKGFEIIYKINN